MSDLFALAAEMADAPRIYPCGRCSRNVSIIDLRMICDGCSLPTKECNCERIPYANT